MATNQGSNSSDIAMLRVIDDKWYLFFLKRDCSNKDSEVWDQCTLHWGSDTGMPPKWPPCRTLVIEMDEKAAIIDFPESILSITSLEHLNVSDCLTFTNIPPTLNVKTLHASCLQAPYWFVGTSMTVLAVSVQQSFMWKYRLQNLYHLLLQGLQTEGRWKQWLTKGLYDPRVFLLVRDLLL